MHIYSLKWSNSSSQPLNDNWVPHHTHTQPRSHQLWRTTHCIFLTTFKDSLQLLSLWIVTLLLGCVGWQGCHRSLQGLSSQLQICSHIHTTAKEASLLITANNSVDHELPHGIRQQHGHPQALVATTNIGFNMVSSGSTHHGPNMIFSSGTNHRYQHGLPWQPRSCTPTWPPAAAQTKDTNMATHGSPDHGHQQWPPTSTQIIGIYTVLGSNMAMLVSLFWDTTWDHFLKGKQKVQFL